MNWRIKSINSDEDGKTVVDVQFWRDENDMDAGQLPNLTKQFVFDLHPPKQVLKINRNGNYLLTSGQQVTPEEKEALEILEVKVSYQYETEAVNYKKIIKNTVEDYWAIAKKLNLQGFDTSDPDAKLLFNGKEIEKATTKIVTTLDDPRGILDEVREQNVKNLVRSNQ